MTVRLCMLARDEEHRIAGVAEAVGAMIDDYCVLVDHRSSDDTEGSIERELGDEGKIVPFRFRDFADARNQLFYHARGGADWLLLADPDSPPTGDLPDLDADVDVYDCEWANGPITYRLPILVRASLDCSYVGACHELLDVPGRHTRGFAEGMRVVVPPKEHSIERMESYLALLERDAATNPRSAFYLARTLRDLGRAGAAIEAYLRRAQMGDAGWTEETFVCLLDAGVLLLPLDVELAETLLRRASLFNPTRAEPLYHLAWLANWAGNAARAEELALAGLALPPANGLFVNRWIEGAGLVEELRKARDPLGADESSTMEPANGIPVH